MGNIQKRKKNTSVYILFYVCIFARRWLVGVFFCLNRKISYFIITIEENITLLVRDLNKIALSLRYHLIPKKNNTQVNILLTRRVTTQKSILIIEDGLAFPGKELLFCLTLLPLPRVTRAYRNTQHTFVHMQNAHTLHYITVMEDESFAEF